MTARKRHLEAISDFREEDYLFVTPSYEKAYREYLRAYPEAEKKRELPKLRKRLELLAKQGLVIIIIGSIISLAVLMSIVPSCAEGDMSEFPWGLAAVAVVFFIASIKVGDDPVKN